MWNYLRVRGEYPHSVSDQAPPVELPPRARRIHGGFTAPGYHIGTTSACAENTTLDPDKDVPYGNYLRVRGEYFSPRVWSSQRAELPPRARRIPNGDPVFTSIFGTTSACAENTGSRPNANANLRNYLRVRGEYAGPALIACVLGELPPRARRIRCLPWLRVAWM